MMILVVDEIFMMLWKEIDRKLKNVYDQVEKIGDYTTKQLWPHYFKCRNR